LRWSNVFAQDEIALAENLRLTLGTKFESNYYNRHRAPASAGSPGSPIRSASYGARYRAQCGRHRASIAISS